jgi:hypothetical protein
VLVAFFAAFALHATARADDSELGSDSWLRGHTFTGAGSCLEVNEGQSLQTGDSVRVFAAGKPMILRRIAYLIRSDRAEQVYKARGFNGVYEGGAIRDSFLCYWGMRAGQTQWVAHCEGIDDEEDLPVAFKGLPKNALTIGGDGKRLSREDLEQASRTLSANIPDEFQRGKVLRAGWRYASAPRSGITEILLGVPFGSGSPWDSIQICILFVQDSRVLTVERLSRVTGVEERVDTEAPELKADNWFKLQEQTMGFFSVSGATSWRRIAINVGFEGVHWSIRAMSPGSPLLWDHYLYTPH